MTSVRFSTIKASKKIALDEFITSWHDFYFGYETKIQAKGQNIEGSINEESVSNQEPEKKSFKKIKRSKTLDICTFLNVIEDIYSKFDSTTAEEINENKIKAKFYDDYNRGENSMDFSSLDTAITPLRDLKIEEPSTFTPFRVKESPKTSAKTNEAAKTTKIDDLKNTLKRNDNGNEEKMSNKQTRKALKKTTTSSRILKFD